MIYETGTILLIKNYQLPSKVKDKFFIVLGTIDNRTILLSMTTSQVYFDSSLIKHGIIRDRDISVYCFEKGRAIGKNGFSFHKNTFISQRSNILSFSLEKIDNLTIEYIDCLTKEETVNILYSFYKYEGTANKYKSFLEEILNNFSLIN